MTLMPPQAFNNLKLLIKKAVVEKWVELTQRITELDGKQSRAWWLASGTIGQRTL